MKYPTIFKSLAAAAALAIGVAFSPAQAEVVTNTTDQLFNAADEVSSTLTVSAGTIITTFVSGTYSAANVVRLQREVGSPGSGAWENVARVTGASTVANARVVTSWLTGTGPEAYRLLMSATGTGAVVAYLTDASVTATNYFRTSNASNTVFFDDFFGENNDGSLTVVNPSLYVTTQGADSEGTIGAITPAIHEGGLVLISGNNAAGSEICISMIDEATHGALPSDGVVVFEVRMRSAQVDGLTYMALQAQNCTANGTADVLADMDSGVFVQVDASNADMIGILRQDEATDTDDWQAFSSLIDTEGANALEVPLGVVTAADTYVVLRVETDTLGNGYFYINNALVHAEALAITPGTRLIPVIITAETVAGGGVVTNTLDYILFIHPRPLT
jgi:hypothetical protein